MKHVFIFIFALLSVLASCKKDSSSTTTSSIVVKNLAADKSQYTLFRLKDSTIVDNADSASNKWDIGFLKTTIIVNGGNNRVGNGGAYVYTGIFDEINQIPETIYFDTDYSNSQLAIPLGSNNGWYNFDMTNFIVTPLAGKVIFIRTADGKYAKLEILSYYKDAPLSPTKEMTARYYTFRYVYQSNGTRKF